MQTTFDDRSGPSQFEPGMFGLPSLDRTHRALADALSALTDAPDPEFARGYLALVAAFERDFRAEEALMEEVGLASFQVHMEQHARMLSALHHTASRVQQGDVGAGREALMLLPQWLAFHIATMDAELARAVQENAADAARTHGR